MGVNILAIDDDPLLIQLLEKALGKAGHRVTAVSDPAEGLRRLDQEAYDLVITDIAMPKLTGIHVLERVKALDATIQVIIFSGAQEEQFENAVDALRLGASDFLTKPLRNMDELMVAVDRAIEKHALAMTIQQLGEHLERTRNSDFLTRLNTRRYFFECVSVELRRAQRHNKHLSCLLVDVDHLDKINKTHGRPCGDQVLVYVARIMRENTRITDILGRYGGEEFVLLLAETRADQGRQAAEKIRRAIEDGRFCFGGQEIPVTVSVGVTGAQGQTSMSELLPQAQQALEDAKRAGRNCVRAAQAT
ncbi:MAG: diguanylate cyclase [Terriglobia bacterium]